MTHGMASCSAYTLYQKPSLPSKCHLVDSLSQFRDQMTSMDVEKNPQSTLTVQTLRTLSNSQDPG